MVLMTSFRFSRVSIISTCLLATSFWSQQAESSPLMNYQRQIQSESCCTIIAHAGGAVDGNVYTNSRQALLGSIQNGLELVELDFSRTEDGAWVATHDWPYWAAHTGFKGALPPTAAQVREYVDAFTPTPSIHGVKATYSTLFLDDVVKIVDANPRVRIITDTKSSAAAQQLAVELKGTASFAQFIFQFYAPADLKRAATFIPKEQLLLTTYQLDDWWQWDGFGAPFLQSLSSFGGLFGITVPLPVAFDPGKMERLKTLGYPILVHGSPNEINSVNLPWELYRLGVNGIYVD